jgi:arylsulfatase A-like enzyme
VRVFERIWDAYLFVLGLLLLELVAVAALAGQLTSAAEGILALLGLGPIAAVCAAPVALAAGAVVEAVARSTKPAARLFVSLAAAVFAALVGWGVSSGRHLAGPARYLFVALLVVLAAAVAHALAPRIPRALGSLAPRRRATVVLVAAAAGALVCDVLNLRVLPRLYPAFHHALAALAILFAAAATLAYGPLGEERQKRPAKSALARAVIALVVFAVAAALTPSSASKVALADNIRLVFLDHAPVLGRAVEVAARIEPPEPFEPELAKGPADAKGTLDARGWDILLITVDALRADHVGAYGYGRKTTPVIDKLASEGVVFESAYTATPHTSYAVTSLMTGKYMRPLLAMGAAHDSETWADLVRRYGYKTAAFYPPAVFFIDEAKFRSFSERSLGFEYARNEFLPAAERPLQVARYMDAEAGQSRVFLWVHLFEPHEPYEAHTGRDFGPRDIDRYDAEIAEADAAVGAIVEAVRSRRPNTLVIISADHGEEFGEHGGRYHGTTVYEEQVRVPLVVNAPALFGPRRVSVPVSLVDLLPTTLSALHAPKPARVRGRDLGAHLTGEAPATDRGFAFAETDEMAMLADDSARLVCVRRAGACTLYDLASDPLQRRDAAASKPDVLADLRAKLRAIDGSHGRYEREGSVREGKGLPEALRRGLGGDVDAAPEVASLLDDADVAVRRKAAEVLFDLKRREVAPALRLAMTREEDPEARAFIALALTRLGEGAPVTYELLEEGTKRQRRLAALALAESGDDRGEETLIAWWRAANVGKAEKADEEDALEFDRAREVLAAFTGLRTEDAVPALIGSLGDVRLRPYIARTLGKLGEDAARPALASRLLDERYEPSRIALTESLLELGGGPELREPLISMLGMPDPLPRGIDYTLKADMLKHVGGPVRDGEKRRLKRFATSGVAVDFFVPDLVKGSTPAEGDAEVRVICRARSRGGGEIRLGRRLGLPSGTEKKAPIPSDLPSLDPERSLVIQVPDAGEPVEVHAPIPKALGVRPGKQATLIVYATQTVDVDTCILVPLRAPLPPPPPEPWEAPKSGN